jgi:hypothetical protein
MDILLYFSWLRWLSHPGAQSLIMLLPRWEYFIFLSLCSGCQRVHDKQFPKSVSQKVIAFKETYQHLQFHQFCIWGQVESVFTAPYFETAVKLAKSVWQNCKHFGNPTKLPNTGTIAIFGNSSQ